MAITTQWMVSPDERDSVAHLPYWKEYSWDYTDIVSGVLYFPLPEGCWILGAALHIVTAVNGTAQDFDGVGDVTDPDGWIADGTLSGAAAGSFIRSAPGDVYPALGGKHYISTATDTTITVTFNVSAGITTGAGKLWLLIGGLTEV